MGLKISHKSYGRNLENQIFIAFSIDFWVQIRYIGVNKK